MILWKVVKEVVWSLEEKERKEHKKIKLIITIKFPIPFLIFHILCSLTILHLTSCIASKQWVSRLNDVWVILAVWVLLVVWVIHAVWLLLVVWAIIVAWVILVVWVLLLLEYSLLFE